VTGPPIASNVEGDGEVTAVALAVDVVGAVLDLDLCQLREGHALSAGGKQPNSGDLVLRFAVSLLIAHDDVVMLLTNQHLAYGIATHRGLDCILDVIRQRFA